MKFIDTHAHLQFEKFADDRDELVKRNSENLLAIINPGADLNSSENAVKLSGNVDNFYAAIGVHPHHVGNWTKDYLPTLEKLMAEDKVVAVGEIGLDKHRYLGYPEPVINDQLGILLPQIGLARGYKKPILFHCREAYNDLYEALKDFKPIVGLMHCFMGNLETAKKFINLGLLISFAGNLTYKNNEHIREVAAYLAEDQILLETDSPYLSPEPKRGERNEPLNISLTAAVLAELRQTNIDQIASATTRNAKKLFEI